MAHRDLKVENVLLDEQTGVFKLCDFGSVTTVRRREMSRKGRSSQKRDIVDTTFHASRARGPKTRWESALPTT